MISVDIRRQLTLFVVSFFLAASPVAARNRVVLTASDGVRVYADDYPAGSAAAPIILLFHQAGSNRGEYLPIAPRLVRLGFHCLAIDQRSGGERWNQPNETVQQRGASTDYLATLPDLEAALAWAHRSHPRSKVLVSSYSSALVFLLAAKHPSEIAAVLSFSPGEYLGTADAVRRAAVRVQAPVFITQATDAEEVSRSRLIWNAVASHRKTLFLPRNNGVHGSSTLRTDTNPTGAEENWRAVKAFLAAFRPAGARAS